MTQQTLTGLDRDTGNAGDLSSGVLADLRARSAAAKANKPHKNVDIWEEFNYLFETLREKYSGLFEGVQYRLKKGTTTASQPNKKEKVFFMLAKHQNINIADVVAFVYEDNPGDGAFNYVKTLVKGKLHGRKFAEIDENGNISLLIDSEDLWLEVEDKMTRDGALKQFDTLKVVYRCSHSHATNHKAKFGCHHAQTLKHSLKPFLRHIRSLTAELDENHPQRQYLEQIDEKMFPVSPAFANELKYWNFKDYWGTKNAEGVTIHHKGYIQY